MKRALPILAVLLFPAAAAAQEQPESPAIGANRGFRLGVGPALLLPTDDGPIGGGLVLDGRYGIKAGPTVIAPGGRLSGYLISSRFVGTAMPTLRVTVPVGPLAPFVLGGVGPGGLTNPNQGGVALLGGGGLMVHFGRVVAIGGEVTYQRITGTEFQALALGPAIHFDG
jgi:hypothetical protein